MKIELKRKDLLYPESSYEIVGVLYSVFTELGYGYKEEQYQKAIEIMFKSRNIDYAKELPIRLSFKGKFLTTLYLDFLVYKKIVLEIKQGNKFNKKDIDQVYNYLVATKLKLGILARFTRTGVKTMRIVNLPYERTK
ncbi:MAG: GxxExxY protein [bacterium]|nr:GxxExxY protein [bacterium]